MLFDILIRYFHFLSILVLASSLACEHLMLKPRLTPELARRLGTVDSIYGLSAILVLTTGLLQWFATGKPASFYTPNPIFHVKVTLFLLIGLSSIRPTVFFLKARKTQTEMEVPKRILMWIRLELVLLVLIPLLAVLMSRGIGL